MSLDVSHHSTQRLDLKLVLAGDDPENPLHWLVLTATPFKYWSEDPAKPAQVTIHAANSDPNNRAIFQAYADAIDAVNAKWFPPAPEGADAPAPAPEPDDFQF